MQQQKDGYIDRLLPRVLAWPKFPLKGGKKKQKFKNVACEVIFVRNQALIGRQDCFKERPIKINLFCLLSKMAGLIPLDGSPVTNIASRCGHFGVDFRVEIALPDGRRFEDATKTGISKKK